jgi:O-antigen/teichoic acid export membrane protein
MSIPNIAHTVITPLSLRKNFLWNFAGNAISGACQWGMLMVIAKLGTPEMVGKYSLGVAICLPVVMFTNLQLRVIQATDAKNQYIFGDYFGLRLITFTLSLLIIAGIVGASGYQWETALVILVVGLAKGFDSISDIFYGLAQKYERMDRIAISMMLRGPLSLLGMGLGVYLTSQVLWGVVGLATAWGLVMVLYDLQSGWFILKTMAQSSECSIQTTKLRNESIWPHWCFSTLIQLARLALPLGLVMMLMSLNNNVPRYFIKHSFGERELGIFAALASTTGIGIIVIYALGHSASPRLAKYYVAGNKAAFLSLLVKLVILGAIIGAAGIVLVLLGGKPLITLLFGPAYAEHMDVLLWLMIAGSISFVAHYITTGITAAQYLRIQTPIYALATMSSVIACFWLIPALGLKGAALALLLAALVQLLGASLIAIYAIANISTE